MHTTSLTEANGSLAKVIAEAAKRRKPTAITRRGEPIAVLIAADEWEDMQDALAVDKAKTEWEAQGRPTVSLAEVKKRLGME